MGYLGALLAFGSATLGVLGDSHDTHGLTPIGWLALLLAATALGLTLEQQRRERARLRVAEQRATLVAISAYDRLEGQAEVLAKVIRMLLFVVHLRRTRSIWATAGQDRDRLLEAEWAETDPTGGPAEDDTDTERAPQPSPRTSPLEAWWYTADLTDHSVVQALRTTSMLPLRSIGGTGPYADPVPWGTDMATFDQVAAREADAALTALESIVGMYQNTLAPQVAMVVHELANSDFSRILRSLPEHLRMRRYWEDLSEDSGYPLLLIESESMADAYLRWAGHVEKLRDSLPRATP